MSDKPPRRWFQLHLSTALVLMFAAAGLMWANFRPRPHPDGYFDPAVYVANPMECDVLRGWPTDAHYQPALYDSCFEMWSTQNTIANALVALAMLVTVTGVCEYHVRRSEGRKP